MVLLFEISLQIYGLSLGLPNTSAYLIGYLLTTNNTWLLFSFHLFVLGLDITFHIKALTLLNLLDIFGYILKDSYLLGLLLLFYLLGSYGLNCLSFFQLFPKLL